ncbi:MAG TPA: S8 family serine peptidase [Gammaproteobacteria bacterium]|nr:S8 family serine peptidase [Gammaproteobacteria bacterium]
MPDVLLEQIRQQHAANGPAVARGVAEGFGLWLRDDHGQPLLPVIVDRQATGRGGFQGRLTAAGARLDDVSRSYARILVPLARLGKLIDAFPDESLRAPFPAKPLFGLGARLSESVALTGADGYQAGNLDGAGTKVAVVDLGFSLLANALASGELPATACDASHSQDFTGTGLTTGTQHGTGVAEHVADMAPGAELYCLKVNDQVGLQNAADYLRTHGIRIANHSVGWVTASYYDDTGAINAIINASHDADGVFWAVAAGNEAQKHWRGTWTDADGDNVLEFAAGDELMALAGTAGTVSVFLNWNQYGNGSKTNLDLYVVDTNNNQVASSTIVQSPNRDPVETVTFFYHASQAPYSLKVTRASGSTSGLDITLFSFYHNFEYPVAASSLMDPANAHGAFSVGAVFKGGWPLADPPIRFYSSQGPTNDGRLKPDLVAPDGTASLTYGNTSSGTSFSAPTVAGAAALLLQEDPLQGAAALAGRLLAEAIDVSVTGPDPVFGAGKLQLPLIDSDADGLSNVMEIQLGTDALNPDTDGDTLSDGDEVNVHGTDPLDTDTDGDLVDDGAEVLAGTDPNNAASFPGDGDVTEDGTIDIRDMLLGLRHLQGLVTLTPAQQAHGDVTRDGNFNLGDMVVIQRRILNLP